MNLPSRFSCRILLSNRGGYVLLWVGLTACSLAATPAVAQSSGPAKHWLMSAREPPGLLGFKRRIAGGDIGDDFFQAVRFIVPKGATIAPADAPTDPLWASQTVYGLQVGRPYRFAVANVRLLEDVLLYPSIELIDRTYPPPGMEVRFAIPIELSYEDLRRAAEGDFVERIVYVEDPELALPVAENRDSSQRVFDVDDDEDPLAVASSLGRPVAVVRLGSKSPGPDGPDETFLFGSPPVQSLVTPTQETVSEYGHADRSPSKRAPLEFGPWNRAPLEIGSLQVGSLEIGPPEMGPPEMRSLEMAPLDSAKQGVFSFDDHRGRRIQP
jgi:hypothetical protein